MRTSMFSVPLLAGILVAGLSLPARAADSAATPATQPSRPAAGEGGLAFPILDRLHKAVDELSLSDDQKTKVEKMFETARGQIKAARDEAGDDRQAAGKKTREAFTTLREGVAGVLTDEQKEQFKTKMQSLFRRGAGAGAGGAGGGEVIGRLRSALEKLDLTADQKQKVKELLESAGKQAKELREQAQSGGDDAREKLRTFMQDTRQKLSDILTDDQKTKLQELMQQSEGAGPAARKPAADSK